MPKFVWEITARGHWAPQLFHGELPREMSTRENAHRYVMHDVTDTMIIAAMAADDFGGVSTLDRFARVFSPPPRYTGKENDDAA
jgi:hypothetical protein